jgi:hypothetical protein
MKKIFDLVFVAVCVSGSVSANASIALGGRWNSECLPGGEAVGSITVSEAIKPKSVIKYIELKDGKAISGDEMYYTSENCEGKFSLSHRYTGNFSVDVDQLTLNLDRREMELPKGNPFSMEPGIYTPPYEVNIALKLKAFEEDKLLFYRDNGGVIYFSLVQDNTDL